MNIKTRMILCYICILFLSSVSPVQQNYLSFSKRDAMKNIALMVAGFSLSLNFNDHPGNVFHYGSLITVYCQAVLS